MFQMPELDLAELKKLKLPVLSLDEKWLEAMNALINEDLKVLMARQIAMAQEEKTARHQLLELGRQKKEILSKLLEQSALIQRNDKDAIAHAERSKAILEKINEELDAIQFKIEIAPTELQKLNSEIIKETISLAYAKILAEKARIDILNTEIQRLRAELLVRNEEKFDLEDSVENLGQFMHSLLGKELSDRMDEHFQLVRAGEHL